MTARWSTFLFACAVLSTVEKASKAVCRKYNYSVIVTFGQSYDVASTRCQTHGLSLPVIQSIDQAQQFGDYLQAKGITNSVWLALRFVWPDATSPLWTHWKDRPERPEPDNTETDKCVVMSSGLRWETRNGGIAHRVVCQHPPDIINDIGPAVFTHLEDHELIGQPLLGMDNTTLLRCSARCLRLCDCDVITLTGSGSCSLYPLAVSFNTLTSPVRQSSFKIRRPPLSV